MSIPTGYLPKGMMNTYFDSMDKYEIRRLRLIELRDKKCRGINAELARRIDKDSSYVDRLFYPKGKGGKKNIGDKTLEAIYKGFPELPFGWMDGYDESNSVTIPINDKESLEMIKLFLKLPKEEQRKLKKLYDVAFERASNDDS